MKRPFWLGVMCRSITPQGKYSGYQIQPDVLGIGIAEPEAGLKARGPGVFIAGEVEA